MEAIVVLGAPGAGKNRICQFLTATGKFVHFSSGDFFRDIMSGFLAETPLADEIRNKINKGEHVDDETTLRLVGEHINSNFARENKIVILDGIPRNMNQFLKIEELFGCKVLAYLFVNTSEEIVLQRIEHRGIVEGRADDLSEESIRKRIDLFLEKTLPIVAEVDSKQLIVVDGGRDILKVCRDVMVGLVDLI